MSAGKRSKHINLQYFFAKYKIDSKEIEIKYMPTADMIADFLQNRYRAHYSKRCADGS